MMEQIVTLFEDFRENNLSYDDLYSALLSKIQQDPSFRHQAIPTLDQVQQSTPIPITHFIQLRSDLDSAVGNFTPADTQQTSNIPADPDATLITPLPGEHSSPNNNNGDTEDNNDHSEDATVVNLSAETQTISNDNVSASAETLIAKPIENVTVDSVDDEDEATMIMPSGTLSGSIPAKTPTNTPAIDSEDETVVNHDTKTAATYESSMAETLVGQTYEQPNNEIAEAETLVGTPTNGATPATFEEPQVSTPEITTPPAKRSIPAVWLWSGTATIVLSIIIIALTSGIFGTDSVEMDSNTKVALPESAESTIEKNDASWGAAPGILQPTPASESVQKNDLTDTPSDPNQLEASADLETANNIVPPEDPTPSTTPEPQQVTTLPLESKVTESADSPNQNSQINMPIEQVTATVAPVITEKIFDSKEDEIAYFMGQINNAINARNLAPAGKLGTATYYLVKLIKASPNSPLISQARSQIAKAHLALAATAREGERWDEAQQHLDDAFTVRLPDSYQTETN